MEEKIKKINVINLLTSLLDKKFYYWSNPGNSGDALIAHSTYLLFDSLNLNYEIIDDTSLLKNQTILFAGGGNLIEGKYDEMYKEILKSVKNNFCIVLPHTVLGYSNLMYETFGNLKIFCRENYSFNNCISSYANKHNIYLSDDMAFYFPKYYFSNFEQKGIGTAYCFRTDAESANLFDLPSNNMDISLSWNGSLWSNKHLAKHVSLSLASYLSNFETIETDRLHIGILGSILKKKVKLFANNYFKNKAVYENSLLERYPHTCFIDINHLH